MKHPELPAEHCANQSPDKVMKMFVHNIAPELKSGSINARSAISQLEVWRKYHPEVFADWETLCWTYVQQPPEWVDWLIKGVTATSDTVTKADDLATVGKAQAHASAAIHLHGTFAENGNPHGNLDIVKVTKQGTPGNSAAYLAARLKKAGRDDLLKQIGPGKQHQSVRSAAIEAGIIIPFPSLQLKDPAPTAQKLLTKKGKAWCLQLLEELSGLLEEPVSE
jgi:stage V sporulation protein SpoVS